MGIQQKLHTRLVQKLILTPSLQQAIKLLPMSTLELSDLLEPGDGREPDARGGSDRGSAAGRGTPPPPRRPERRAAGEQDRDLGRPGLRVLLRRLPGRRLPAAGAAGSQGAAADREHALDLELAVRPPDVAALDADRRAAHARNRLGHHRQPGRRRVSGGVVRRAGGDGAVAVAEVERALRLVQSFDPDRRRGARPAGVPAAPAPAPRPRGHADREDRHRAPAAAAEPSGPGDRPQAGPDDRRPQGAHRDHPESRSEAGQPLQPRRSRSTSFPTSTSSRSRTSTSPC